MASAPNEPDRGRRRFVDGILWTSVTALAAAVAYPVVRFLSPPRIPEAAGAQVVAAKVSEMESLRWKLFPLGQEPGILVKTAPGEFRAFTATCTHLDCTVQLHEDSNRIWCPCHNGWYDLEGRNVEGPPPHPLTQFTVQVEGDDIIVTRA